jgi:ribosome modulation factor
METDLQTALPAEIGFNFEELKTELAEKLEHYNTLVVTEDGIKEAKDDRARLNKLRTAIDTRRKDIKKQYLKPYNEFEGPVKELTLLIDQPIAAIDTQLCAYEEKRKAEKLEKIQQAYDAGISDTIKDIVPFNRILDQKWLNATTSMKKVVEDITAIDSRVNADMLALDTIEEQYKTACRKVYVDTLDITKALSHRDELKAAEEAFIAREAERKAREEAQRAREEERRAKAEEQAALQAQKAAEAKSEPQAAPEEYPRYEVPEPEKVYALRLEFHVTREQAIALRRFVDENQINFKKLA